jgi:uridine kinase
MIIGICGGSGSGKTTLLERLADHFSDLQPSVFSLDNYYLPVEKQIKDQKGHYNFDLPSALDEEKLLSDLKQLIDGQSIQVKEYHFNAPPNKHTYFTIKPSRLLIVEGLFLLHFEKVKELLDFTVYIKIDPDVQLERRIARDLISRGYTKEEIVYQWENHVLPCYRKYLLPYRHQADFIYRNDTNAESDFKKLIEEISLRALIKV